MVFGELSALFPILASDAYHRGAWKGRKGFKFAELFEKGAGVPDYTAATKKPAKAKASR
jgi:hypothetical protein